MCKGLRALKTLGLYELTDVKQFVKDYCREEYKIIEKELKALEIIKEKGNFINLEYDEFNNKYYIYDNELYIHNEITKEEYELLRGVLL